MDQADIQEWLIVGDNPFGDMKNKLWNQLLVYLSELLPLFIVILAFPKLAILWLLRFYKHCLNTTNVKNEQSNGNPSGE